MNNKSHFHLSNYKNSELKQGHVSVLLNEVKSKLDIKDGHTYVDGTFGSGGHTNMMLCNSRCKVFSIDRDPNVKIFAKKIKKEFPKNFKLIIGKISEMHSLLRREGINSVNGGILFDLGVSSMQIENPKRGFSFRYDGPLDMRMDEKGERAIDIIKKYDEDSLATIIYKFGEEKKARKIAKAIVKKREETSLTNTLQLAEVIRSAVGYSANKKIDPATKTFQALRIKVNNELEEIRSALYAAEKLLSPGARLVVITFHSLEDTIVKSFLKNKSGVRSNPSRHSVNFNEDDDILASFKIINKKVIRASDREVFLNPRSRSAKLRAAEKITNNLESAA